MKKTDKNAEIRELTLADLREQVDTEKTHYIQMKINHAVSPLEKTSSIKTARRNIARMLTILAQRENNEKK
jgi:large subunit ribosomal protein L29